MLFIFAEILTRAAYTAFYLRIVPVQLYLKLERNFLLVAYGVYATVQVTAAFIYFFQCGLHMVPSASTTTAQCIGPATLNGFFQIIFIFDCIFDWLMVLIPMRVVWNNVISQRNKIGVLTILSLGCCAGVLAIIVLSLSHKQKDYSQADTEDMRLGLQIDIAATCEVVVAMLCLCLATYKPLFRRWLDTCSSKGKEPCQWWFMSTPPTPPNPAFLAVVSEGSGSTIGCLDIFDTKTKIVLTRTVDVESEMA